MNPKLGQPVKNKHKVPKKAWNKWHNLARRVFNTLYESMRPRMQWAFLHPDAAPMSRQHWETVRWNASWEAAQAANGAGKLTSVVMDGKTYKQAPKKKAAKK